MSEYLLLNIFIIAIPLFLSFERKIEYYKKLPALLLSIIIVGGAFIIWDVIATIRGDWIFNTEYTFNLKLFRLPIEELLFFITVPYASLFLYETLKLYFTEKQIDFKKTYAYVIGVFLLVLAVVSFNNSYSLIVLLITAMFILLAANIHHCLLCSKIYWMWIVIMFMPFLFVNYILTSLPIVIYSRKAIWDFRISTIPVEDILYSFSFLSFNLLVYLLAKDRWLAKKYQ
jgi:lycopene cyclase domain-containing protein